jgi:predicted component of type VI protein secretion system
MRTNINLNKQLESMLAMMSAMASIQGEMVNREQIDSVLQTVVKGYEKHNGLSPEIEDIIEALDDVIEKYEERQS